MALNNDFLMQPLSDEELAGITGGNDEQDELDACLRDCEEQYPNMKGKRVSCRMTCMGQYGYL